MKLPLPVAIVLSLTAAAPLHAQTVAYTGATLWDGTGAPPVANATLLVRDGLVLAAGAVRVPGDASVVDLSGRWIMPGLVDAHAHVTGRWAPEDVAGSEARVAADLLLFARYGVTSVVSLGDEPPEALTLRVGHGPSDRPRARLRAAGPVVTAETATDARLAVGANADAGVDWVKIRVDDNLGTTRKMPWPAVEAVLDEAHRRGRRVASHVFYLEDAKRLLRGGTDLVAHSVRDRAVDPDLVALLRERGVCYVPTLTRELSTFVYADAPTFLGDPFFLRFADPREVARVSQPAFQREMAESPAAARYRTALRQAQENLAALSGAGVHIAFGTDAGPPARFPGYFEHLELELMADAGLSPAVILRSATAGAASCMGLDDVGTLEPGKWADFLVLTADPLLDVRNTRTLDSVYVGGRLVR